MTNTVSNAVAKRDTGPQALIKQYSADFSTVLPSHIKAETWVRLAQGVLRRDEKLRRAAEANPSSFLAALLDCARLGHEPGTDAYALVPFGNEVQGIEQYQGEIERMYRAGAVSSVVAEVVHGKDDFEYTPGRYDRPQHSIDWDADDRGPLRLVYAYAVMKDGAVSRVAVLNKAMVMRHKAMSRSANSPDSPWRKWEESMWLKTAVHELEKWVPTSSEYLSARIRVAAEAQRAAQRMPVAPPRRPAEPDVIDGEIVDEPAVPDAETAEKPQVSASEQVPKVEVPRQARPITGGQSKRLHATLGELGITDARREDKLAVLSEITSRPISSSGELSLDEAKLAIDTLDGLIGNAERNLVLAELVERGRQVRAGGDGGSGG